jgi:glucose/arabinose dehydrogenase
MPGRRSMLTLLAGALLALVTACQPVKPPPPPPAPDLTVSTFLGGLNIPWDLAFASDGALIYTERPNGISVFVGGQKRLLEKPADLVVASEAGMMGLTLDPGFASNRRLYACFASNAPGGGVQDVRVVRWTVDAGYTALANRTDIVTGMPVNTVGEAGRHSGCRPRFGPDGFLWIGTGDSATGIVPVDLNSLGGKVLRVDANGSPAPGNPFIGQPGDDRVYTYGHRNVQGLAFRPNSGQAFGAEHGPVCDDELNRLVAGGNYGWDGDSDGDPGYEENVPMTDFAQFPDAIGAVWNSGCPTVAPSGSAFLTGSQWETWDGTLVLGLLKDDAAVGHRLRILRLNGAGTSATVVADQLVGTYGRLRTPVLGPDGNLYVTTSNGSNDRILKVTPS